MKLNHILVSGFLLVALLVGAVGFVGIQAQETTQSGKDLERYLSGLSQKQNLLFQIIESSDHSDFSELTEELKQIDKNIKEIEQLLPESEGVRQLISLDDNYQDSSKKIVSVHKELLDQEIIFANAYPTEKQQRYNIRVPLFAIDDRQLTEDVGFMQYFSKETLYQSPDQEHLDEWIESIKKVKVGVDSSILSLEERDAILSEIDAYEEVAQKMGEIAIRGQEIKDEELVEIEKINALSKENFQLSLAIEDDIQDSIQMNKRVLVAVILITLLLAVILGLYMSHLISKPIQKITDAFDEISKGNFNVDIEKGSRIKELLTLQESISRTTASMKLAVLEAMKKKEPTLPQEKNFDSEDQA